MKGALSAAEQSAALETVREYARRYTASLPNYTCTQLTRQTMTPAARADGSSGIPLQTDVIEEHVSFLNGREIRTVTKINGGRPAAERARTRALSDGEFGSLLDTIFKPQSGAGIRWTRAATLHGQRLYVFVSRSAIERLRAGGIAGPNPGSLRRIRLRRSSDRAVIRIEMKCTGIPSNFEFRSVNLTLDYKSAKIADREFRLPSSSVRYDTIGNGAFISAQYESCHRFSADSTVTFDGDSAGTGVAVARCQEEASDVSQKTTVAENAAGAEVKQDTNFRFSTTALLRRLACFLLIIPNPPRRLRRLRASSPIGSGAADRRRFFLTNCLSTTTTLPDLTSTRARKPCRH